MKIPTYEYRDEATGVSLSFRFNADKEKEEKKAFLKLMETAVADLRKELLL